MNARDQCLEYLRKANGGLCTAAEITRAYGRPSSTIRGELRDLTQEGVIERIEVVPGRGSYRITRNSLPEVPQVSLGSVPDVDRLIELTEEIGRLVAERDRIAAVIKGRVT